MAILTPWRSALAGALGLLVVGELVARLQGDRLCTDRAGVVYERDADLGWRHVPNLSGRAGSCDTPAVPPTPLETDADGFVGPPRPRAKPPGTVRFLLLGGNMPEAFGVTREESIAGLLEILADERRGARLEVLNGATGGWALDNSLEFFRRHGANRAPDVVILVLDPVADLATISPGYLAAFGRRVPAKPYFSLVGDTLERTPPFEVAPGAGPPPPPGPLAFSRLYRVLRGIPAHTGEPMAWALAGTFPHGTVEEERERNLDLAKAMLRTLRDEVAAAGGTLVTVVAPLPGATGADATGRVERDRLIRVVEEQGIPLLDLTRPLDVSQSLGQPVYLEGSVRLNGGGHGLAAGAIWGFLNSRGLLPPQLVAARMPGSGRVIPPLASLPRVAGDALWASRHGLAGRFVQFGLLAVCAVWLVTPLPAAARDWVLVGLGVGMLGLLGSANAALFGAALALVWYGVVELLPPLPATAIAAVLAAALVAATIRAPMTHVSGEAWAGPVLIAGASNIALLRLIAYAVDRRRGAARLRLRTFLAAMLFFPALPGGPVQSPVGFAMRAGVPDAGPLVRSLGRVAWGWVAFTLGPQFLALRSSDVFATGGADLGRARLWVFVGEVALLLTLLLSGWSHMAIGLGRLAGANLPENLRRPWRAPDVAEFWRRWHATLTEWLHDYLYVPIGRGALPVFVIFLASAAWQGWAFTKTLGRSGFPLRAWRGLLVWALLNAVAVAVTHARARRGAPAAQPAPAGLGGGWRVALTAVFVALAWLPLMLPQFNRLRDLGAVYLRLFGLR